MALEQYVCCEPLHHQTRLVRGIAPDAKYLGTGVQGSWISLPWEGIISIETRCAYVLSAVRSVCSFLAIGFYRLENGCSWGFLSDLLRGNQEQQSPRQSHMGASMQ